MKTYYNDPVEPLNFEDKELNKNEVRDYFQALPVHKDAFIGLIDVYDEVIIFYPKSENNWLLDHIVVSNVLHRQRYATTEECLDIIGKIYQERDINLFEGFEDVPVQEFTLDEMLRFKKEDKALLNEEESPIQTVPAPVAEPIVSIKQKRNRPPSMVMGEQLGVKKNKQTPIPPKSKKTPSKLLQQIETTVKKEVTPSKIKPTVEKTIKKASKPTTDDNSFFQI